VLGREQAAVVEDQGTAYRPWGPAGKSGPGPVEVPQVERAPAEEHS
jgi:hypothetical protein